jgi:hypothetical protein
MINLLSFALFEKKFEPFQLEKTFKKYLDKNVTFGALLNYDILNAEDPSKVQLQVTNWRNETIKVEMWYLPIVKMDGPNDLTNYDRKYYSVQRYIIIKYYDFINDARKTYLQSRQVSKIKVGDIEVSKEDVINHVQELDVYKKILQDFDLKNITTVREAKNGTISFYYKYTIPYKKEEPTFKISGKSGNIYDCRGIGKTVVKYGPMTSLEDYKKALNGLCDYLTRYFYKKIKKFKIELQDNPSLKDSNPGLYKMMQRLDNPALFKNDKLTKLVNTGLFD